MNDIVKHTLKLAGYAFIIVGVFLVNFRDQVIHFFGM